jgi:hypothetical protein
MITSNVDISAAKSQSNLDKLMNVANAQFDEERVDKAASEFEEMMFGHLVKYMFETTEGSALWGEGHGADIMRSMFIDAIAKSGGAKSLNIKDSIKKSMYGNSSPQHDLQTMKGNLDVTF